jgi:hypothetical protein
VSQLPEGSRERAAKRGRCGLNNTHYSHFIDHNGRYSHTIDECHGANYSHIIGDRCYSHITDESLGASYYHIIYDGRHHSHDDLGANCGHVIDDGNFRVGSHINDDDFVSVGSYSAYREA